MERKSFGQFILVDLLWRDAGELWRAMDRSNAGREVSLKLYSAGDWSLPFVDREVKALHGIEHECVHRLLDFGAVEGRPFLVFEPLDGSFLRARLSEKHGGLSLGEALPIFNDILSALVHIHAMSLVHRRLKPDNIFIGENGRAKLTDFSFAGREPSTEITGHPLDSLDGEVIGTPAYMAPEQWADAQVADSRTDLYALGLLLYESLAGEQPFKAQTVTELAAAHLNAEPPSLLKARPDLPAGLEAIYRRL